jgi:hypothetical protein
MGLTDQNNMVFLAAKKLSKLTFFLGLVPKPPKLIMPVEKHSVSVLIFLYSKPFPVTTIVLEENDLLSLAHEKLAKIDFTIHPLTICSLYNYLCSQIQIEDMLKLYLMTNLMVTL